MKKPTVVITMGDACGVGPEVVIKSLTHPEIREICRPVVVGNTSVLGRYRDSLAPELTFMPPGGDLSFGEVEVIDPDPDPWHGEPVLGRATREAGEASLSYIRKAVAMIQDGEADALATGPINKEAIRMAGSSFPGHTEMLADLTGTKDYAMMLVGGKLRVSLATIHIPLSEVPEALSIDGVLGTIRLTHRAALDMGVPHPRIAVCGLNPHAGEAGLFGEEETEVIGPAVEKALSEGMKVQGPLPADTVFHLALKGDFDAQVAMYHDQGLGPLKTVCFDEAVNVTLGLPIIRTSVDHGTAYDIAGDGVASPASMIEAIRLAARMAGVR